MYNAEVLETDYIQPWQQHRRKDIVNPEEIQEDHIYRELRTNSLQHQSALTAVLSKLHIEYAGIAVITKESSLKKPFKFGYL